MQQHPLRKSFAARFGFFHGFACFLLAFVFWALPAHLYAQQITLADTSQQGVSFRGMSIARDGAIWVSGSKGTVGVSRNGGATWQWVNPPGYAGRDFRDTEGFSGNTALIMAVDSPGVILRTTDGGNHWSVVYENHTRGIFLDDMSFRPGGEGLCAGDQLEDGRLLLLRTTDSGKTWHPLQPQQRPLVARGEAMFAASGGNTAPHPSEADAWLLATGGHRSRLWTLYPSKPGKPPVSREIPIVQGGIMTGANAIFTIGEYVLIPGGNYTKPSESDSVLVVLYKKNPPLRLPMPGGYISSLADNGYTGRVACGITGVQVHLGPYPTYPGAWQKITATPFHVVRNQPGSSIFFMAGPNGRIAKIILSQ